MSMFRFRLQQVLDLKESRERQLASQLAQALGAERDAQAQLHDLRAVRDASATPGVAGARQVGELANLAFVLDRLDGHIASAADAVVQAGETVSEAKGALTIALQSRRVLDLLRARHAESHRAAEVQHDRRTMDDIALTRYTQGEGQ